MQGLEFAPEKSAGEIVSLALEKGLILMTAGNNVIRFVPPLIIEEKHVDEMMKILREVLKEKDC